MTEQWLSIVEYARTFKVSDMTVRRRIKTGKLHAILQDGKYFIPVAGNGTNQTKGIPTPSPEPRRHPESRGFPEPVSSPNYLAPRPQNTHQELVVVKGQQVGAKPALQAAFRADEAELEAEGSIPGSLRRPLSAQETSLIDTRALLAYCDASLKKVSENERRTVEKFKSKLEALEATLVTRDLELKATRQQVEDLQLLVKILERRKQAGA